MRRLFLALGLTGPVSGAIAGDLDFPDMPTLRGSSPDLAAPPSYFPGWQGIYGGGNIGYSRMGVDFAGGASSLVSYIVRNSIFSDKVPGWTTLPKGDVSGSSFGGFFGYNQQWDEVIVGLEVNYSRTSLTKAASDSIARFFTDDTQAPPGHHFTYDVAVSANGSVRITDLMTFRARAGWVVDTLLPYAFAGFAVARADVVRSATVSSVQTDNPDVTVPATPVIPPVFFGPVTQTDGKTGGYHFGYTAGLGVDYLMTENIFLRGEWELIYLPDVRNFKITVNTARVGAGLKF